MEIPSDRPTPAAPAPGPDEDARQRILRASPLDNLAGHCRGAFLELARVDRLARRVRLVEQGEPAKHLVLIGSGRIKLERMRSGRVFPLGHRGPGETVGESALGSSTTATENATV